MSSHRKMFSLQRTCHLRGLQVFVLGFVVFFLSTFEVRVAASLTWNVRVLVPWCQVEFANATRTRHQFPSRDTTRTTNLAKRATPVCAEQDTNTARIRANRMSNQVSQHKARVAPRTSAMTTIHRSQQQHREWLDMRGHARIPCFARKSKQQTYQIVCLFKLRNTPKRASSHISGCVNTANRTWHHCGLTCGSANFF